MALNEDGLWAPGEYGDACAQRMDVVRRTCMSADTVDDPVAKLIMLQCAERILYSIKAFPEERPVFKLYQFPTGTNDE